MITVAAILERNARRWWLCPNTPCRQTIGELIGCRLVIETHGRRLTYPLVDGMTQTCPRCGQESLWKPTP